ncbi:MAG: hypothetical protein KDE45_05540 [Caldilineaceae bacterium]|nr:hypothetical protein [Caldilineaceae bacterium]
MMARMSSSEYLAWLAYYGLEPFGEERADLRNAMSMAQQANLYRGKGQRAARVEAFMPAFDTFDRVPADDSDRVLMAELTLQAHFMAMGGTVAEWEQAHGN